MSVFSKGNRILFQGDSITNCFRLPEEKNNAYQLGSGYPLLIASRILATYPQEGLSFFNRGVSGEALAHVAKRWNEDAIALEPSVISLLVGVNNTLHKYSDPSSIDHSDLRDGRFANEYRELIKITKEELPKVQFVLCEPFLLNAGTITAEMRADVAARASVVRQIAKDMDAIFVPLQKQFDNAANEGGAAYWAYDGIHPTAAGHWLIAQAWLEAVGL